MSTCRLGRNAFLFLCVLIANEDSSSSFASQPEKEEVVSRSIFAVNVEYACTREEVQQHFQSCGTVNRELTHRQQFYFWKNYRNSRLKHILPRPLPELVPALLAPAPSVHSC